MCVCGAGALARSSGGILPAARFWESVPRSQANETPAGEPPGRRRYKVRES
jgi:hypothetical protein